MTILIPKKDTTETSTKQLENGTTIINIYTTDTNKEESKSEKTQNIELNIKDLINKIVGILPDVNIEICPFIQSSSEWSFTGGKISLNWGSSNNRQDLSDCLNYLIDTALKPLNNSDCNS